MPNPNTQPGQLAPVAVLDVDGVLADVRHRLHHLDARPKDWDAFFAAAPADPPLPAGVDLAHELARTHRIVYVTGRPERCRAHTVVWLRDQGLPDGEVRMRADGDHRPARLTKLAEIRRLARTASVSIVVDDDPRVCEVLSDAGFMVRQAEWMPRAETLDAAQERGGRS